MIVVYSNLNEYNEDVQNSSFLRLILDKCEKFEGKEITQRIVTYLNKEIPEYRFWLEKSPSYSYLIVHFENKTLQILLPYSFIWNRDTIWNETSGAIGFYAEQRIRKYEAYLSSDVKNEKEKIDVKIQELKNEISKLENEQYEMVTKFLKWIE